MVSRERLTRLEDPHGHPAPPDLSGGGGGGTSDGMEARVAKLEAHMEHVRENMAQLAADTSAIRKDVGQLAIEVSAAKSKLEQLPSKTWVGVVVAAELAAFVAVLTALARLGILAAP